jgi:hypothetical protein
LNNNRNNRRRGRGNRQQGGGNQNRIDSRARGNAPQLLDKYKKLAQDAAHNGDRVQAEYYLQFADHYFRVIADNKSRQDETRGGSGRRDDRDYRSDDDGDEDDFDAPRPSQGRQNDRQDDRQNDRSSDRSGERQTPRSRGPRGDREEGSRFQRDESERHQNEGEEISGSDNPFVRENREHTRSDEADAAPRRGRPRRRDNSRDEGPADDSGEIDASALPPSISANAAIDESEDKPKRKLPPRRRRPAADEAGEDGESLKAVG